MKKDIERHLKASWSPEQIHGRYQYENKPIVSFKTIYNWIYNGQLEVSVETLRRKGIFYFSSITFFKVIVSFICVK